MEETFENVLRKIILPLYPYVEDVRVSRLGLGDLFKVTFLCRGNNLTTKDAYKIMQECESLLSMLGIKGSETIVDFEKIK